MQAAAGLLGPSLQEGPCRVLGAGCTRGCCFAAWVLEAGRAPLRGTRAAARSRGSGRRPEPCREGSRSLCPSLSSFLCFPRAAEAPRCAGRPWQAESHRAAPARCAKAGAAPAAVCGGGQPAAGLLEPPRGAAEPLSSSRPPAGTAQGALPAACTAPAFPGKCDAGKSAATGSKH